MSDTTDPEPTTRRSLLDTVAAGTLGTALFAGVASADGDASPDYCVEHTEYRCADADCDCCSCGCDCDTVQQKRTCCEDAATGEILHCGPWVDTGTCCSYC